MFLNTGLRRNPSLRSPLRTTSRPLPSITITNMGCCGEPRDKPSPQNNNGGEGMIYHPAYPTSTQPQPQPQLTYPEQPYDPNGANSHQYSTQMNGVSQHNGVFNPAYPPGPLPSSPPPGSNSAFQHGPMLDPNVLRPSPVHAAITRDSTGSPPLGLGSPNTFTGHGSPSAPSSSTTHPIDDGKLSISVECVYST